MRLKRWKADRDRAKRERRRHNDQDPDCVYWWGDRAGMDLRARCRVCNPLPPVELPDPSTWFPGNAGDEQRRPNSGVSPSNQLFGPWLDIYSGMHYTGESPDSLKLKQVREVNEFSTRGLVYRDAEGKTSVPTRRLDFNGLTPSPETGRQVAMNELMFTPAGPEAAGADFTAYSEHLVYGLNVESAEDSVVWFWTACDDTGAVVERDGSFTYLREAIESASEHARTYRPPMDAESLLGHFADVLASNDEGDFINRIEPGADASAMVVVLKNGQRFTLMAYPLA